MTPARRRRRWLALLGGATLLTLAWPAASSADTSLGGYAGTARSEALRVEIYEPSIPLPSDPQIDGGIAYTRAHADTGPVTRSTASYLWPGDVVGDGFEQITGHPGDKYPVQVNSRYPATADSPAHNTAQISGGNGMTTSTDGTTTQGTVTGLGIDGPNALSNPLQGLCGLLNPAGCPSAPSTPQVPVQVSQTLATIASTSNVRSQSTVTLAAKTITSTATAHLSQVKLLAGLITVGSVDTTTTTVSDGVKATTTGTTTMTGLTVAGQTIALGSKGVTLGGSTATLPNLPLDLLKTLGIEIQYTPSQRTVSGGSGELDAQGLVISVDTKPLKQALQLGSLLAPLAKLVAQIPQLGDKLAPLFGLGPKIVIVLGDVTSSAEAAPAYVGPPVTGGAGGSGGTGGTGGTGTGVTGGAGGTGGTGTGLTGGSAGGPTGGSSPVGTAGTPTTPGTSVSNPLQPVAFGLPGLATVPRLLILGALALAALIGWGFRAAGGFLLGGGRDCAYGLASGVPDLRKG